MDNNIISMCLHFLIIQPSASGLRSEALPISVVSVLSPTGSSIGSLKIKSRLLFNDEIQRICFVE